MTGPLLLVLDESIPPPLAAELRARGREARSVAELDLGAAGDAEVLARAGRAAVLVTADDRIPAARGRGTVAVVDRAPPDVRLDVWRRDVVHRWAPQMQAQPRGSARRYALTTHRAWTARG